MASGESILLMDPVHPTQALKESCGGIKIGFDKPTEKTIHLRVSQYEVFLLIH